jgi:hypothetical protein
VYLLLILISACINKNNPCFPFFSQTLAHLLLILINTTSVPSFSQAPAYLLLILINTASFFCYGGLLTITIGPAINKHHMCLRSFSQAPVYLLLILINTASFFCYGGLLAITIGPTPGTPSTMPPPFSTRMPAFHFPQGVHITLMLLFVACKHTFILVLVSRHAKIVSIHIHTQARFTACKNNKHTHSYSCSFHGMLKLQVHTFILVLVSRHAKIVSTHIHTRARFTACKNVSFALIWW